jgi:two-component system, LuxR family, response regulator FixJ
MSDKPTVFVVDDDEQARKSVCALVRSMNVPAEAFASAEDFLAQYTADRPGCLVTDYRMVGMNGLELHEELVRRKIFLPFIVLTAHARTPLTVRAMQGGAITLLDKPYADDDLWEAIRRALVEHAAWQTAQAKCGELRERLARLTPAERHILTLLAEGKPNKQIANELDLSLRTVENRRHEILAKMEAGSLAELIRLWIDSGESA